jgi:hypothetical protein
MAGVVAVCCWQQRAAKKVIARTVTSSGKQTGAVYVLTGLEVFCLAAAGSHTGSEDMYAMDCP